jgi:hypothetical protein
MIVKPLLAKRARSSNGEQARTATLHDFTHNDKLNSS